MSSVWVVTADAGRARIFSADSPTAPLQLLQELISPEARMREQDLTSDRPGRSFDSVGTGRHATEPRTHAKDQEATRFAGEIAAHLRRGRDDGAFSRLVLVLEPHFLGLIRKAIDPAVAKMVTVEITKDLNQASAEDIRNHLPDRI